MNLNCLYSQTGVYDLNDKNIDWSNTILLDKFNNKMVLLGGLLEFNFTDISDDFTQIVDAAYKQTALSQQGGVKLYNSLIDVTDQLKNGLSDEIKKAFDNLKEIQDARNKTENIFGSNRLGAANMDELLKNFRLYTELVNTTLGEHEEKLASLGDIDKSFPEIAADAAAAKADADAAKTAAESATAQATNAVSVAGEAKTAAEAAQADAADAKSVADEAKTAADDAASVADEAKSTADAAKTAADAAQADVDEVKETVESIQQKFEDLAGDKLENINENYNSIKELADYVEAHGKDFNDIQKEIFGEVVTDEESGEEEVVKNGILRDIEHLKSMIGEGNGEDGDDSLAERVAAVEDVLNDKVSEEGEVEAKGLVSRVADVEEAVENAVVYKEVAGKKTVELQAGESLSAADAAGENHSLVGLSVTDTAEFGAADVDFNINSKTDKVTINNYKTIATTDDIELVSISALADLRAKLNIDKEVADIVLSSSAALDKLDATVAPAKYDSITILGGETDKALKLNADSVNIMNMTVGKYGDEATSKTTGKNRLLVSTNELMINNLSVAGDCDSYNIVECDSKTPLQKVDVINMDVQYPNITHNIVNLYCLEDNAKVSVSNCKFSLNPTLSNPVRFSNYNNAENVTVVFSNVEWTYEAAGTDNFEYAGLVLYQPAHTDKALAGDYSAMKTWKFIFKNCKYNGVKVTANNFGEHNVAMYVYNKAVIDPETLGFSLSFE